VVGGFFILKRGVIELVKLVINAGHSKETPGKRTPDGTMREYDFNSAVAKQVRDNLEEYENVQVFFPHSDKMDVPLHERTDYANDEVKADAYISIHANAFSGVWNSANGIETFIHPNAGEDTKQLAKLIHTELIEMTKRKDRGVKTADFHELRETDMPAVLVECGFMTNLVESKLLKTVSYRLLCARAITEGLVTYFRLKKKKAGTGTRKFHRVQVGAFQDKENAEKLAKQLNSLGFPVTITYN
jgi:N-acetylmuramoyl-L-alanine amidase